TQKELGKMSWMSVDEFLVQCKKSGDAAYASLRSLLERLDNPETRHHGRNKLTMMVIPSIFLPEDWSFTFDEGINRHPDSIFKERTVAELGCGNGWISIAIAEKWLPYKVYGLDINPRAVKVSWINLYLNALDENGHLIYDVENKTLLDRVEFHESDLLSYCREKDIQLERIVGCLPQVIPQRIVVCLSLR
ncbi:Methionine S-methyltransferase, partial [Glycine soja]